MRMPLLSLAPAVLLVAAGFTPAHAAQVTVGYQKSADQSSWSAQAQTSGIDVSGSPLWLRVSLAPTGGGSPVATDALLLETTHAGQKVNVVLESSGDLSVWADDLPGIHDLSGGEKFFTFRQQTSYDNFVFVEGGTFLLEGLQMTALSSFYIGKYEVTVEEWDRVRDWGSLNGYTDLPVGGGCGAGDHPVSDISWYAALKWCNARSEMEGRTPVYYTNDAHTAVYRTGSHNVTIAQLLMSADGYRLPTRAEWVFAALGGNNSNFYTYSGSNDITQVAWFIGNSAGAECDLAATRGSWPVGQKSGNELGIHDMSGNVIEWCWDAFGFLLFSPEPVFDPLAPSFAQSGRVGKGGGWSSDPSDCEPAIPYNFSETEAADNLGLRVVHR